MGDHTSTQATKWVTLAGGAAFAFGYVFFHFLVPASAWTSSAVEPVVSFAVAGLIAVVAMATTAALLAWKLIRLNLRMRVAVNNMSQGLCMFDGNERLVVYNRRYMEMYNL